MSKLATKDEERKALAKIREIVDSLGKNSYIGIAMEGMWELIEENINDDFGNSHKDMIEARDNEINRLHEELTEVRAKNDKLKADLASRIERVAQLEKTIESDNKVIEEYIRYRNDLENKYNAVKIDYQVLIETTDNEIMRLKAKLYDYMVRKEENEAK